MEKIELIDSFLSQDIVKEYQDLEISTDKLDKIANDVFKKQENLINFNISRTVGVVENKNNFVYGIFQEKLYNFNIDKCGFANVIFKGCRINNSSFSNVVFYKCIFNKSHLFESNYSNCFFIHCKFNNVEIDNNSYYNTNFINCEFKETKMDGSDIDEQDGIKVIEDENFLKTYYPDIPVVSKIETTERGKVATLKNENDDAKKTTNNRLCLERIEGQEFNNTTINKEYYYENCIFKNCKFSEHYTNDYFIHCKFESCNFNAAHFLFIPFDNSNFKNCNFSQSTTFTYCSFVNTKFVSSFNEFGEELQSNTIDSSTEFHYCNFVESDYDCNDYDENITYEYSFMEVEPEIIEKVKIKTEKVEVIKEPESTEEILQFFTNILADYQKLKKSVQFKKYMENSLITDNDATDIDDKFEDDEEQGLL